MPVHTMEIANTHMPRSEGETSDSEGEPASEAPKFQTSVESVGEEPPPILAKAQEKKEGLGAPERKHARKGSFLHLPVDKRPKCAKCRQPIHLEAKSIKNKHFHPDCMTCSYAVCNRFLPDGEPVYLYYDKDDRKNKKWLPYCKDHCLYTPPYMGHCSAALCRDIVLLGKPITTVNGKKYHQACVYCCICGCTFPTGRGVYMKNRKFYCKADYEKHAADRCSECNEALAPGSMIVKMGEKKMHATCVPLNDSETDANEATKPQFQCKDNDSQPGLDLNQRDTPGSSESVDQRLEAKTVNQPVQREPGQKFQADAKHTRDVEALSNSRHSRLRSVIQDRESPLESGDFGLLTFSESLEDVDYDDMSPSPPPVYRPNTNAPKEAKPPKVVDNAVRRNLRAFSQDLTKVADALASKPRRKANVSRPPGLPRPSRPPAAAKPRQRRSSLLAQAKPTDKTEQNDQPKPSDSQTRAVRSKSVLALARMFNKS